ncbi:SDR family NAD(P)-dependent oxidoreductase [Kribbella sp. CA-253562]|uniref:SDR family NAD(P)-dependent oxidoreductase n=1 Tax=Kribbella sp. CA-253562 TaxID=3239942 RepID=UPI003D941871
MELGLAGRKVLVTGSSSGLGAEVARVLAAEGAAVVVHGRDQERAEQVAKEIVADGGKASVAIGDLGTEEGADEVARAATVDGPVDVLVNNVGVFEPAKGWADLKAADWARLYDVNVLTSVRLIERLVPAMRERGWGRVIQIGSVIGSLPSARQPHYGASNAARENLAASLARELSGTGVTSNAIAVGGIVTPAAEESLTALGRKQGWGQTWEEIEPTLTRELAPNNIGRLGRLHEIASAVAYLASPGAAYITGTTLHVNGGWYDAPAA